MEATATANEFLAIINNKKKFTLFLLQKLPAAFFSGVRVQKVSDESCTASVPFKWFTQNPFRSTYFACLSMAAELSTGVLAMANTYKRKPGVSMLVTGLQSKFYKKAVGKTYFTCNDGLLMRQAVEQAIATGQGQMVKAFSKGVNESGEVIAEFWIEWSFKSKTN